MDDARFERRVRAVLSFAPIIHFATGPDGIIRYSDGGGLRAMGLAPGQNVGSSIYQIYGGAPWILEGFRRALAGESGSATGVMAGQWFSIQYVPLLDAAGAVEEVVGIATNLEEQHESEARYQRLASATFEAVAIHDRGIIIDANARLAEMFGYQPSELVGMNALALTAPESRDEVQRRIARGGEEIYEAIGLRKDGSKFPGELRGRMLPSGPRILRVTSIRDLTERNRLLDAERAARAAAEEALDLREEFLSIASHELKTPLTSLMLQLGQLSTLVGDADAPAARAVEISLRQTRRLARLVSDLLDASRIRTGRLSLQLEEIDLSVVVRDALALLGSEIARSGSSIELQTAPARGRWDRQRIEQVASNLIANALSYGLGKPIKIRVDSGELVRLTVEDQGVGIPAEGREKIFERYERAAPPRIGGGLGLGLYIARQIVRAHDGALRVDSTPGQGSTFTVELPAAGPARG